MLLPIGYIVLLPWIQTSLSWKHEIVIRVKELFEPIYFFEKKSDGFLLFL